MIKMQTKTERRVSPWWSLPGLTIAAALGIATAVEGQERQAASGSASLGVTTSEFLAEDGETLYMTVCAGCHQPQGQGAIGAGQYPALSANPTLQGGRYPAWVIVNGVSGMPALGGWLSDAQVVEIVSYLQTHLGNDYEPTLTEETVAGLRDAPTP